MLYRLRISNDFLALRRIGAWLEESCSALGIAASQRFEIDLAANEVVMNVISYGYTGGRVGDIELRLSLADGQVSLEIEDDGRPFNPLEIDAHRAPEAIEDAKVGGLGIHFVRTTMPDCRYRREGNHNVLTMKAPLAAGEAEAQPSAQPQQKG